MKLLIALLLLAAPPGPATVRNMDSVVKVSIGKAIQATGLIVSDQGHVLITSVVADACGPDGLVISQAAGSPGTHQAKLLAFDRQVGLGLVKADVPLGRPVAVETPSSLAAEDGLSIVGVRHPEGKVFVLAPIVFQGYGDAELAKRGWSPAMLTDYFGAFGMIGAGGFSDRTGRLLGVIQGKHTVREKGEARSLTVLTPAWTISRFLSEHDIPQQRKE